MLLFLEKVLKEMRSLESTERNAEALVRSLDERLMNEMKSYEVNREELKRISSARNTQISLNSTIALKNQILEQKRRELIQKKENMKRRKVSRVSLPGIFLQIVFFSNFQFATSPTVITKFSNRASPMPSNAGTPKLARPGELNQLIPNCHEIPKMAIPKREFGNVFTKLELDEQGKPMNQQEPQKSPRNFVAEKL
jgi:hypothetical protein